METAHSLMNWMKLTGQGDRSQSIDYLTAAYPLLRAAVSNAQLAEILAPSGYDDVCLADGLALYETVQTVQAQRSVALSRLERYEQAFNEAEIEARQMFREFRSAVRFWFKDMRQRVQLGIEGREPQELERFIPVARAAYRTALHVPTYQRLQHNSCLVGANLALERLVQASQTLETERRLAYSLTKRLDEATVQLDAWARSFYQTAFPVLQPYFDLGISFS